MTFADSAGESKVTLAQVGPVTTDGVTCTTALFENRGPATFASIYMIDDAISGLGLVYPPVVEDGDNIIIKLGIASKDKA